MEHVNALLGGLGNGAVFAALALAIALTYRSSGVINFATGSIALFAAYTYAYLRDGKLLLLVPGLPVSVDLGSDVGFLAATAIALVITAILGGLLYLLVFRPLRDAPPLARAVASIGVLVVIQGLMTIRVGLRPVKAAAIFEFQRWTIGDVTLLSDRVYLAISVVLLAGAVAAVYRFTRFGLLTRASAESQVGAYVSGISPDRNAFVNWMVSAAVAGLAGILIAPLSPLTPIQYTLFVVPALAAAVVGNFTSIGVIVTAGFAIGMLQNEAKALAFQHSWLPSTGAGELIPLIIIVGALVVTGRGMPVRGMLVRQTLGRAPRPRGLLLPTVAGLAAGVVLLAVTDGSWRAAVIATFISGVVALSMIVVTGYAGQVSLAQLTLAGVSAFTLTYVSTTWGVPFPLAPLLAALVATGIGVAIGLPALRVRGLALGIVTLAFAYAIEAVWFRNTQFVSSAGGATKKPELFGVDLGLGIGSKAYPRLEFGLLCLVVLVAVAFGVARLRTSKLGAAMLAVRANESSAAGSGINVVMVKLVAFAISSFIAGLGGALMAYRSSRVSWEAYSTIGNLTLLTTVYLAGVTSVSGGVLAGMLVAGGLVFFAMEQWLNMGDWFPVVTGVLVIVTVIKNPEGLAVAFHRLADVIARFRPRRERSIVVPSEEPATPAEGEPERVLDVSHLTVRYGGVTAVADVSLHVDAGSIVGLIGPNGAGKTSVIDAVTGFARSQGTVEAVGTRVDGLRAYRRVRAGLARTFQSLDLYDDLTVEENVNVGASRNTLDERPLAVAVALELVGISDLRDRPAGELSQGQRQLVSIARACASEPKLLLLDEPAAGLDTAETRWLGERIQAIAARGVGVLLVDHDVGLVLSICDHVYVLDFGDVIASGDPEAIRGNDAVAEAYLGHAQDATVTTA